MKTFAKYQIIGRVGRIIPAGPTLKVSVGVDYAPYNTVEKLHRPHRSRATSC